MAVWGQPRPAERSHLYGRPVHEPTRRRRFLLTALLLLLFWPLTIVNLAFNIGGGSSGVAGACPRGFGRRLQRRAVVLRSGWLAAEYSSQPTEIGLRNRPSRWPHLTNPASSRQSRRPCGTPARDTFVDSFADDHERAAAAPGGRRFPRSELTRPSATKRGRRPHQLETRTL